VTPYLVIGAAGALLVAVWIAYRTGVRNGSTREHVRWLNAQSQAATAALDALEDMHAESERTHRTVQDALAGDIGTIADVADELSRFTPGGQSRNSTSS